MIDIDIENILSCGRIMDEKEKDAMIAFDRELNKVIETLLKAIC
jgi:hypothetical protein